ncbi:hypothetical protein RHSIM_Rhsim05G0008000 [Rhododendron simsii]|uniref:PGG domain-containing protein n=1 Tax=Rhododendron simsii TaxID=118357 RepID=A0A834H074_RHOSS|nr:hypothetical protein RHSIM_Rhsim05G0008000 [Rhododendron simsii]
MLKTPKRDEDVPVEFENYAEDSSRAEFGIENPVKNSELPAHKYYWARFLVPGVKDIRLKKQKHQQALQLVRYLIKVMLTLNDLNEYDSLATEAMISATRLGIHEVVEEIVEAVPNLAWVRDSEDYSLFQRAVIQRHENIFNLIYQMSDHKRCQTLLLDKSHNTILHLAGKLAPPDKLQWVNGAVLQMQREFQWYKEVKKNVKPSDVQRLNKDKETQQWYLQENMRTIIAVPGGNNDYGLPNFSKEWAFTVFVISDALSLFTSATSVLLFLSILTSRYAESDFRDVLPRQLIYGLVTLFLSITTMIMAFSVSLYLVLGHKKAWILVPVAALAFLPISSFVSLQFPLLVDLISSAYGSIFGRKSAGELDPVSGTAPDSVRETASVRETVSVIRSIPNSSPLLSGRSSKLKYSDLALDLVHRYPQLAVSQAFNDDDCGLGAIARQVNAFRSGTHLNFWERIVYDHVPVKFKNYAEDSSRSVEIGIDENPVNNTEQPVRKYHCARFLASQKMQAMLWKCFLLVPCVKRIRHQKQKHQQALQLVRYLIKEMLSLNDLNEYDSLATNAIVSATRLGIHEVVEEIVQSVPKLAWVRDSENRSLFQRAVTERHENIFNLIYQMSDHKHCATLVMDKSGNTILHLAGQLAPLKKLNLVNGAVLQMQRELQWFQEVKKFVKPSDLQRPNEDKETPAMVFTREHKDLVVAGGEWMKNTAYSCSISAALIATVVFAAIITVPGGNRDSNGLPNFSKESSFTIFVISDALSLFTSATSLLLFLSILTSRYAESDFLDVLPKRLINGLATLFLSITTMIVAFSVSLYLALGHKKAWILVPLAALAYLPIRFVSLQFSLLVDLISSTYGSGIFGKQSDKQFF